jgi:molybdopterin molybdotransferase
MSLPSLDRALAILLERCRRVAEIEMEELGALPGRALASDIVATEPYPLFDNSAVDGYAISCLEDGLVGRKLRLAGRAWAGHGLPGPIEAGTAWRVLTGAPVPDNAVAVVMQEDVEVENGEVTIRSEAKEAQHIRRKGSDVVPGDVLLTAGQTLNAGSQALLASQGIMEAPVFRRVRVAILATGDELVEPRLKPEAGQIRETNGLMLRTLVSRSGGAPVVTVTVRDDPALLAAALKRWCQDADVVLISGGASVGDRDYVAQVVGDLGQVVLHGVAMKPGKPFLFGEVGSCAVLGLPGNPGSVFVGFHLLVRPFLRKLGGHAPPMGHWFPVELLEDVRTAGREEFLRVKLEFSSGALVARLAGEQGSFGLRSLAEADALARVPAHTHHVRGHTVWATSVAL